MSGEENTTLPKYASLLKLRPQTQLENVCSSQLEDCINYMWIEVSIALKFDHLSIKEDKRVIQAVRKHESSCERLELTDSREVKKETEAWLETKVKKSFRNVLYGLACCDPYALYLSLNAKQDKKMDVEEVFIGSLQKCVAQNFVTSREEEAVSVEMDNELNDKLHLLSKKINLADLQIDRYKGGIRDFKLKMQDVPDVSCLTDEDYQSYVEAVNKSASLQQKIDLLLIQLNNLFMENRCKERQIQEGTDKVIGETEYVIQCFDEKMEKNQVNLEAREVELRRDQEELRKLVKLYVVLEVQYNEVLERRRLAEEKRKEEIRILQLKTRAAIIAQAWWRGYCVRKAIRKEAEKKAKKGKGKKAKKSKIK